MVSATSLTGAAGEHFVMSQLLRRGLIAALAPADRWSDDRQSALAPTHSRSPAGRIRR